MILNAVQHVVVVARPLRDGETPHGEVVAGWTAGEPVEQTWIVLRRWPPGREARVDYAQPPAESTVDGIPVAPRPTGRITNLPDAVVGVFYIVSATTHAEAVAAGRSDTLCPDTTWDPLRDATGRNIRAVRRLLR